MNPKSEELLSDALYALANKEKTQTPEVATARALIAIAMILDDVRRLIATIPVE